MSKSKKKKKGGYKPPVQTAQDIVDAIVEVADKIYATDEPGPLWGELHKAFLKSDVDKQVAAKIIMHKDIQELRTVVAQLQTSGQVELQETEVTELPTLDHETQIEAMRCFRKRVKFIKLDRESKLGVGPLSDWRPYSLRSGYTQDCPDEGINFLKL